MVVLIFSTVRGAKSYPSRNFGPAPNSNIPDHIRSARKSKTARITQRTGRLKGLNRLLERALPVGWVLQGRPNCRRLLLDPSNAAATAVPWKYLPGEPAPEGRKTQTCRRGTTRVLKIAESARRVNGVPRFAPNPPPLDSEETIRTCTLEPALPESIALPIQRRRDSGLRNYP
jgi:hypothetical protein